MDSLIQILTFVNLAAPSMGPAMVTATTPTTLTSITITWTEIACKERNGEIDGYNVTYCPQKSDAAVCDADSDKVSVHVIGEYNRTLTVSRLLPRTNYTFEVRGFNGEMVGPPTTANFTTLTPEGS